MIDTHTHLNDSKYDSDLDEVVSRARASGVERMVVCGSDLASSRRAVEIAAGYDGVYATVGVHPHDAKTFDADAIKALSELAARDKVIAIGEIGLDFHYDFSPRRDQTAAFESQLALAHQLGMPVVVHSREAHSETVSVLKTAGNPLGGVFHCFSEDIKAAEQVLDMGFYIGIDGPVTFKTSDELRRVVEFCPLERLLIETDCPYLAPVPHRGKRNEPAYLGLVCDAVARLKAISRETAAQATTQNALRLFERIERPQ